MKDRDDKFWWNLSGVAKRQYKRERLKEGISEYDCWDLDDYLLHIISTGLEKLANTTISYPGFEPYETYEKWVAYLHNLSKRFKEYAELDTFEYYPERVDELTEKRNQLFLELSKVLPMLWN